MCIGGVFGGFGFRRDGGDHRRILGIACFHPTWIRKTSPSFWLEYGRFFPLRAWFGSEQYDVCIETCRLVDTGSWRESKITGAVQDVYPAVAGQPYTVEVTYEKINTLIGKDIPVETVKSILAKP